MSSLAGKLRFYVEGAAEIVRLGRPEVSLGFLGGIGDDLLSSVAIDEWLKRGVRRVWFFSRHPELYAHYDHRVRILPERGPHARMALRLGRPMRALSYSDFDSATDRDTPLQEHIIAQICRRAGLTGPVRLHPQLPLSPGELAKAGAWSGSVAVQTSSLAASVPMRNKQWPIERMQAVVNHFAGRLKFVQIGSLSDPPLGGVTDLRGKTTLRATAAVLARARLFVGLVGFLMHLARAVDCPGVIVYGGREPPELTGYPCNENLAHRPQCAPCWQRNRCDFGHVCMESIDTARVIAAVEGMLARPRTAVLPETSIQL